MSVGNDKRATRRTTGMFLACGGVLALLVGCSTSVDGADVGELGSTQQAIYAGDPCFIDPTDPMCDNYGEPVSEPSTPSGAVYNTTYWRIEHSGWQLTVSAPFAGDDGTGTTTNSDLLKATLTMKRTTSSPTTLTARGFGAAIVRQIPKPGGTINSTCTKNSDCWPNNQIVATADDSFNYCVKVGTNTNKTCVQRPGGNPQWGRKVAPTDKTFALGESAPFSLPASGGAPYGTTTPIGSDKYSTMAVLNLVGGVTAGTDANGNDVKLPPCMLTTVLSPNGIPYEEDPQFCAKLVRPAVTLTKWRCGDGVCNGNEDEASCAGDCYTPCPAYCDAKPWLSGCDAC